MKVILVGGARPNFMKIAPIWWEMKRFPKILQPIILHTGQHYDENMSDLFFEDLGLPEPNVYLGIGSASHVTQTAKIMVGFEKFLAKERPKLVVVVGDVNSTLACSIVASKLGIPIAHVEAGLRSFDRTMPEEINRIVTDSLSDFLFTTCEDANENLKREGIAKEKIYFVGNVMIDTLLKLKNRAKLKAKIKIEERDYALVTLHRPSNVDDRDIFRKILQALREISRKIPIIFPAHPRTRRRIKQFGYEKYFNFLNPTSLTNSINLIDPLSYLDFLSLMVNTKLVLTDSGGIQEETTYLGIPCLTIRENTERPITIKEGTNILVKSDKDKIINESLKILDGKRKVGRIPKLWDGKAAQRIVKLLRKNIIEKVLC